MVLIIMEMTRNSYQIKFRFEKKEWAVRNGKACKEFLEELKKLINPDHRDFDSTTLTWTIAGSFERIIDQLQAKYFIDPNQQDLFQ